MSYHCFSRRLVAARKPHVCVWCSRPVVQGSFYIRENSVYDGGFQNFAWHEACRKDADDWFAESGEEEFISGQEMPFAALYALEANGDAS